MLGPGRMVEPNDIIDLIISSLKNGPLANKIVTITAGPTREQIDPVRFISNNSSGKMGYSIAEAALELGSTS
jgi:phosphopantothenoylcysteine decarboxylase/phosphopantothenate--cysteine ligase